MIDDDLVGSEQSQSVDVEIGSNVDLSGVGEDGRKGKAGGQFHYLTLNGG